MVRLIGLPLVLLVILEKSPSVVRGDPYMVGHVRVSISGLSMQDSTKKISKDIT